MSGVVGAAYAVTLATGRYDDLIGEPYRIATTRAMPAIEPQRPFSGREYG